MKLFQITLLISLLSCLPFLTIFLTPELPHTSDGGVQLPRMAAFYTALRDGHFPVRWAGDLNYGYGLPLFNFIYHTPFYLSSLFIAFGFELIPTFKIVLFLSYLLSGIFMFLFSYRFFQDSKSAMLITVLYQFAPYRFVETLTRGSVGGIYAYTFLPLVLFFLVTSWNKPSLGRYAAISLAGSLMILSHNALAVLFFACVGLFVLFFARTWKQVVTSFISLAGALGIAAYYWLPAIIEHRFTYGDLFMKDLYKSHFPPFLNFFLPNLTNSPMLRVAEINVHIGIVHTVLIFITVFLLAQQISTHFHSKQKAIKHNTQNMFRRLNFLLTHAKTDKNFAFRISLYSLTIITIAFMFMSPISLPVWDHLSFLRQFQFPWRFLGIVVFASSLLGFTLHRFFTRHTHIYIFCLLCIIIPTMFYWRSTQGFTYGATNEYFWKYPLNTTYFGETDVIWSAGPANSYPEKRIEAIEGKAIISDFRKTTHVQTFSVNSETGATLVSRTQYFPGWRVYVNNIKTPIEFQNQLYRGMITFPIPPGQSNVRIQFEESTIRYIADICSLMSLSIVSLFLGITAVKSLKRNYTSI